MEPAGPACAKTHLHKIDIAVLGRLQTHQDAIRRLASDPKTAPRVCGVLEQRRSGEGKIHWQDIERLLVNRMMHYLCRPAAGLNHFTSLPATLPLPVNGHRDSLMHSQRQH